MKKTKTPETKAPGTVTVSLALMDQVTSYLIGRPYVEVAKLLAGLSNELKPQAPQK